MVFRYIVQFVNDEQISFSVCMDVYGVHKN